MLGLSFKRVRRVVGAVVADAADDVRDTARRASRNILRVGERVGAGTKRTGKRAARHAKDIAGDVTDTLARGAQSFEERFRGDRGDRFLKGFPRPLQLDDYSCGVQCTMAILEYFGSERRERELRRELHTTKSGTDVDNIVAVLRAHGCRCTIFEHGRRETLSRAIANRAPVLVEVDGDHWAVLYGLGPDQVYLADPSVRRSPGVVLGWDEFRARWDRAGVVVRRGKRRG